MDGQKLFTIKVFELRNSTTEQPNSKEIEQFPNMLSAGIMKGRMVELEHSRLVGPSVKFKTVINYDKSLEPGDTLGLSFIPQETSAGMNRD